MSVSSAADHGAARRPSSVEGIFDSLSINNMPLPSSPFKTGGSKEPSSVSITRPSSSSHRENIPPQSSFLPAHRIHRPEDIRWTPSALRNKVTTSPSKLVGVPPQNLKIRRRNSDSSTLTDFTAEPITEEELKMIEATRRKAKEDEEMRIEEAKKKRLPRRTDRRVDIIDQLDATGVFGIVHHDGPFDALHPHRNRRGSRRAPMEAFPKDSLNNVLGGSGPVNIRPDHAAFMGNKDDEAFKDYASGTVKSGFGFQDPARREIPVFDPLSRGSIVHGDETIGLGTSTFLEGTPAARTVIERTEAEKAMEEEVQTLQRKKSLAQRIRHINKGGYNGPAGRFIGPDGTSVHRSLSLPGPASSPPTLPGETNPFFTSKDKESNVTETEIATPEIGGPTFSGNSPQVQIQQQQAQKRNSRGSERRAFDTTGNSPTSPTSDDNLTKSSGGGGTGSLLARVKSLKGSGRRRASSDAQSQPQTQPQTQPSQPPGSMLWKRKKRMAIW